MDFSGNADDFLSQISVSEGAARSLLSCKQPPGPGHGEVRALCSMLTDVLSSATRVSRSQHGKIH